MRCGKDLLLGSLTLGFLGAAASAQSEIQVLPKTLIGEGDTIIGMGRMISSTNVAYNNSGTWIALIDTDFGDTNTDGAILRSGFVTLREGSSLFSPANSTIDDFTSIDLSDRGDLGLALAIRIDGSGSEGAFWNTIPVAVKNQVVVAAPLGANSTWLAMDVVKLNASNQLFVMGEVQNTAVTGSKEAILMRFDMDEVGNVLGKTVLTTKNMPIPAFNNDDSTKSLTNVDHGLAVNKHGDFITVVTTNLNFTTYMRNMETVLAQQEQPSPVPNRNWRTLSNAPKICLNDFGDYIFAAAVYGDEVNGAATSLYLVEKNGEKYAMEGDFIPSFSASPMSKGSAAPMYISNSGDVYWWAQSTSGTDDAFMRNFEPIVQLNSTMVGTNVVNKVEPTENAFHVSRDGRFWIGRVTVQGIGTMILFADFGVVVPMPGCHGNLGKLRLASGKALPGDHLEFEMDNGQAVGVRSLLVVSTRARVDANECGILSPRGELLIHPAYKLATIGLPAWNGTPSRRSMDIPVDVSLVDATFYAQGFFWDMGDVSPAENFRLTNALRIEIGAP